MIWARIENFLPAELQRQILDFASGLWHEILPTSVPSRRFADSRFTINGWVRR